MVGTPHYLILSAALFTIGIIGVLTRRNIMIILMSIELMMNAVNINLIAFSNHFQQVTGQIFAIFVITVAAAEAAVGLGIVIGIGFLIYVYSSGYMHEEDGFYRFFAYLNLFMLSMLTLILGGNYLMMFIGWEGVGLCSYLLIGYYFLKRSAGDAAKKAFVVNRVGDWGLSIGIMLIFVSFGTLEFTEVGEAVRKGAEAGLFNVGDTLFIAIAIALFIGATGKSA